MRSGGKGASPGDLSLLFHIVKAVGLEARMLCRHSIREEPLMIWGVARAKAGKKTHRLLAQEKKTQLNNPEEKFNG